MPNPVLENLTDFNPDHTGLDTNLPVGSSGAAVGASQDLSGNLRLLKSVIRGLSIHMSWERWLGVRNLAANGDIAFTFSSGTVFTVNDNFVSGTNRAVAIVGRRVRATLAASVIHGTISVAVWSSPTTTVTVVWDSGALTNPITEIEFGLETLSLPALPAIALSQITGLVAALAGKVAIAGDTMTGALILRMAVPTIILRDVNGVATGDSDWLINANPTVSGSIVLHSNAGTEAAPNYVARYTFEPSGTPVSPTDLVHVAFVEAAVAAAAGRQALFSPFGAAAIGASQTLYFSLSGGGGSSLESDHVSAAPIAGTFKNLFVRTVGTQPASGSLVITLRKNSAASALVVTVPANGGAGTFSNTSDSLAVAQGDLINWQGVNNATASAATIISISAEFTTS